LSKKIEWLASDEQIVDSVPMPRPAKTYMPEWYKKMPKYTNNKMKMISVKSEDSDQDKRPNLTLKSCMPFLDTFMTGYIQETWCDIHIGIKDGELSYEWAMSPQIISNRDKLSDENFNKNKEYYDIEFEWRQYWVPKMPRGYSMVYVHPLNRLDLPFFSLSGVIDNDRFFTRQTGGAHPFFIKKDFQGVIPAGTTMYQMIPVKRESWKSDTGKVDNYGSLFTSPRRFFQDGYKLMYWQKKEYL
jgi:hypothetical protein